MWPHYLLDTCVLIHAIRETATGRRIVSERRLDSEAVRSAISIVTVGELYAFARRRGWGPPRMTALEELIGELDILDISNAEIIDFYAELDILRHTFVPRPAIGKNDLWIAATARYLDVPLITTDGDFLPYSPTHLNLVHYPTP
jgi:tRNA(fMet)-specific endonuclease VapC